MKDIEELAEEQNNKGICKHKDLNREFNGQQDFNPKYQCEECDGFNYNCENYEE